MSGMGSAEQILAILDLFTEDRLRWRPREIMATLRGVRCDDYAGARGEVTPGAIGIAAPAFAGASIHIAALCHTSDGRLMPADGVPDAAHQVRRGAGGGAERTGGASGEYRETA